ncbi:MAG TPA: hypothetical protein VHY20_06595 [Pirellulales bacterium]|jgi:hypothetical protein|nr:hypothetical protein [Pirellulales bacterium]
MPCANFEPRLQELFDAGLMSPEQIADDPLVAGHASQCAACRQLLSAMLAVVGAEAAMRSAASPPAITLRVLAQLRPASQRPVPLDPTARRRVLPLRMWAPLAAAASLLIAFSAWHWLASAPTPQPMAPSPSIAAAGTSAPVEPSAADADAWSLNPDLDLGLTGLSDEVREGLAPVTRSTAGTLESLWQAIAPPEDSRS